MNRVKNVQNFKIYSGLSLLSFTLLSTFAYVKSINPNLWQFVKTIGSFKKWAAQTALLLYASYDWTLQSLNFVLKKIKLLIFTLFADVIHQVMLFQQAQTIQFFVILVFMWLFCFYSKSSPQRCFPLKSCPTPLRRASHPSIQHFSRHVLTLRNVLEKFCKVSKNNSLSDKSGK